ncbi:hypothetical protein [Ulvibacter antarcticus]|uniref:Threonine/homoserine/homoserine lactone efflux protein n=1 Tax=Ulvibacter antarcticus TaxID=442714 RepID=A0A3L9Y7H0_9FLAO|nr:hypothetical protein [Ulvibacter antarcticus]RMA56661.1 threonine/homoserine/homoserine lactone efflux protein [Ulvibacter antarcticus]
MFLLYLLLGMLISILGTIPMSATNISVIATTKEESLPKALPIAFGAGLGEMMLAVIAVFYSNSIANFFETNQWIQITSVVIFIIIGFLFIFPKLVDVDFKVDSSGQKRPSKFITGFLLGFLNPGGVLYYILAVSLAQQYIISISKVSPLLFLMLFFAGVYIGKWVTLYVYGKLSAKFEDKERGKNTKMYRIIGIILVVISTAQGIRMLIS